jgi:single-strand DNA-binding protein
MAAAKPTEKTMDRNEVILRGNLGDAPKIFDEPGKTPFVVFSLATNLKFKNNTGELIEITQWHQVVCSDWRAEVARHFTKGMKIHLEGYNRAREYDKGNNAKGYAHEVVALDLHEVKFAPRENAQPNPQAPNNGASDSPQAKPAYI